MSLPLLMSQQLNTSPALPPLMPLRVMQAKTEDLELSPLLVLSPLPCPVTQIPTQMHMQLTQIPNKGHMQTKVHSSQPQKLKRLLP